jgi:hypothetical protein
MTLRSGRESSTKTPLLVALVAETKVRPATGLRD